MTTTEEISREDAKTAKSKLPDGWRLVKLGDISELTGGNGAPQEAEAFAGGTIPFVRMKDVGRYRFTLSLVETDDLLTEDALRKYKMRVFPVGTILMPRSGSVYTNHRARLGVPATVVGHLAALLPRDDVFDSNFVTLALKLVDMRQWMTKTTGLDSIGFTELSEVLIPFPPLAEQKRIAGILKEQMAAVERARASAEAQLQAAEHLPAAYLRTVFDNGESKSWPRKKLGDIFKVKSGESMTAKAMTKGGQYPVYGGNGINGYHDAYLLHESRVVIGRVGANCGCIHVSEPKSWITDNALYVSEKLVEFDNDFMADALRFLDLNGKSNSMAQPLVTGQLIYPLEIGFPPVADQHRIAAQLSSQMAAAERLRQTLTDQLDAINKLPAALLRRAFNGEI